MTDDARQTAHVFEKEVRRTVRLGYLLYLPPDYDEAGAPWPLLIFLHGMGERGDDLEQLKLHGPPKLIAEGRDLPFIVVSPQCSDTSFWPVETEGLDALLDELCATLNVDERRICLTGLSMGGYGTWDWAVQKPDRFAALAPVCGRGTPSKAGAIKDIPCWVFHGAKDETVPIDGSEEMVEALRAAGGTPKFTVYPEAGHDSWTETYANEELYEWLLEQRR